MRYAYYVYVGRRVIKENGEEEREDVERVVVRGEGSQVQASAAFILHIL